MHLRTCTIIFTQLVIFNGSYSFRVSSSHHILVNLSLNVRIKIVLYKEKECTKGDHSKSTYASNLDGPLPMVPVSARKIKSARAQTGSLGSKKK